MSAGAELDPNAAAIRRERRELIARRETEIRDLGGLLLEMVRRDRIRLELLVERASDVLAIERRLHDLDLKLVGAPARTRRRARAAPRCKCGAPVVPGTHFCANCGRPAPETEPVASCSHCGQPLPADTNFCAFCGNTVASEEFPLAIESVDATMVREAPSEARR